MKKSWQQQLKVSVSWQNFNTHDTLCTWHFPSYCDRHPKVAAFPNRNINLHLSSWPNACHRLCIENKNWWNRKLFYIHHSQSWNNLKSTYTEAKIKWKKRNSDIFRFIFTNLIVSFIPLIISIKIFFNRTRKLLLWKCNLRKTFVMTLI